MADFSTAHAPVAVWEGGYGNHPAVVRFFNRMADALMEDSPALGQPGHEMPPLEERMYAGWSSRG